MMFVTARTPLDWLSNLKVQTERSPGAVYLIRSQGKYRIQLPSVFLGGRQKVGRELFLSEAEREKRAHTKQNKTKQKAIHTTNPSARHPQDHTFDISHSLPKAIAIAVSAPCSLLGMV